MRAVVSRVGMARCVVDGEVTGEIGLGLLVYVGVIEGDGEGEAAWLAKKLVGLRIFSDHEGKMNRSVVDEAGGLLLVSNFTLGARTKKGTRPSFVDAAEPGEAERLFDRVVALCGREVRVGTGRFGYHMDIESVADGPVTIILDSTV